MPQKTNIKSKKITEAVIGVLKDHPSGLRYTDIFKKVKEILPDQKENTITGAMWRIEISNPQDIYKVKKGFYKHTNFRSSGENLSISQNTIGENVLHEQDFYEGFANYLKFELEECTEVVVLGGNRFGARWGTPDVVGKYKSRDTDVVKRETEIVTAEIKIDAQSLITAFGQACAYLLFSHKVYIVVPKSSQEDDISRLESLCLVLGIGLVVFDSTNKQNPDFEIKARPIKREPDIFYVNKYMRMIEQELF